MTNTLIGLAFSIIISIILLILQLFGKHLVRIKQNSQNDDKAVGMELATTGIGVYAGITVLQQHLLGAFIIFIFIQFIMWLCCIIATIDLLDITHTELRRIKRYQHRINLLGLTVLGLGILIGFWQGI